MRLVPAWILLTMAVQSLCAQSTTLAAQEAARARQLLHSTQWMEKAWGVYLAGRLHPADLRDSLLEEFRLAEPARSAASNTGEYAFVAALFDAAIESGITVPAALLQPFEEKWIDPVVILLARDRENEEALLRLSDAKSRSTVWLAVNNLLLEKRSNRWYAGILGSVSVTHRFTVSDPDSGIGIDGGSAGATCGDGIAAMPKGFPPITLFTLADTPQQGSVLLVSGPRNAYYNRKVVPPDAQVGIGSCSTTFDWQAMRIGYLAQLANQSAPEVERLFHRNTYITYQSVEDFEQRANTSLKLQELGIQALIQQIKKGGMNGASGLRLRIVPEVRDQRQHPADSLPAVPPGEIVLN